jgi:hypothetical protein
MNQTILTTGTKITRGTPDRNNKQHQSTINDLTRFITNGAEYSDTLQAIFRYFVVDKAGLYDYKLEVIDGDISMCGQYITQYEFTAQGCNEPKYIGIIKKININGENYYKFDTDYDITRIY